MIPVPCPPVAGVFVGGSDEVSSPSWKALVSDSEASWSRGSGPEDRTPYVKVACESPVVMNGVVVGCGKCEPCRILWSKRWGNRIQLEMMTHKENLFVTLTYDDEHLPMEGSLHKKELSGFVKRLRRRIEFHTGCRFRFFACGEYGSRTGRAHYHLILFGVGMWAKQHIEGAWGRGYTSISAAGRASSHYVAGYCVKKMDVVDRLPCEPEFVLMSRRPGIGAGFADMMADEALHSAHCYDEYGDILGYVNVGKFKVGLGSYLRRRIRLQLHGSPSGPIEKRREYEEAVYALQSSAKDNFRNSAFVDKVKIVQLVQRFNRSRQNETL